MFKIRVSSLSENGLKLEQELPIESVNQRLLESPKADENPIVFNSDINAELQCEKAAFGMSLSGKLGAKCTQDCGLCARKIERNLNVPVKHIFKFHSDAATLPEEDLGVTYYTGDHVEIGPCVEDLIILQLSPFWHPEIDAEGKCSECQENPRGKFVKVRPGSQSLGEALKKAGIK